MDILIFDLSESVANGLYQALASSNCCVIAKNQEEASELLSVYDFDVVVTDLDLPGDIGKKIKQQANYCHKTCVINFSMTRNHDASYIYCSKNDSIQGVVKTVNLLKNRHKKLLIIDDIEGVREILYETFREYFRCSTAENGRDASETLSKEHFDLVLTDIDMPCGGGEQVLQELSPIQSTKVYVYSGGISEQDRKVYDKLGASGVFSKPEEFDKMVSDLTKIALKTA